MGGGPREYPDPPALPDEPSGPPEARRDPVTSDRRVAVAAVAVPGEADVVRPARAAR